MPEEVVLEEEVASAAAQEEASVAAEVALVAVSVAVALAVAVLAVVGNKLQRLVNRKNYIVFISWILNFLL